MSNYDIIREAILNKQQVIAVYKEHRREMCPHVIGTKNDRKQALFYQFGGTSRSGKIVPNSSNNWRCIPVLELQNVEVCNGKWYTSENHSRTQTCVGEIDVEVRL